MAMRLGAVCRCAGRWGHEAHPGKRAAIQAASYHKQGVQAGIVPCWSCEAGRVTGVFRCEQDEAIYHWGHR